MKTKLKMLHKIVRFPAKKIIREHKRNPLREDTERGISNVNPGIFKIGTWG